jgi:hypothetical protein
LMLLLLCCCCAAAAVLLCNCLVISACSQSYLGGKIQECIIHVEVFACIKSSFVATCDG